MFTLNDRVRVIQNCIIIGEHVKEGLTGTVIATSSTFGTMTTVVKFEDGRILPMYAYEIASLEEQAHAHDPPQS